MTNDTVDDTCSTKWQQFIFRKLMVFLINLLFVFGYEIKNWSHRGHRLFRTIEEIRTAIFISVCIVSTYHPWWYAAFLLCMQISGSVKSSNCAIIVTIAIAHHYNGSIQHRSHSFHLLSSPHCGGDHFNQPDPGSTWSQLNAFHAL